MTERDADDVMEMIADLPTTGDWKERSLLNHIYDLHKLRDHNLHMSMRGDLLDEQDLDEAHLLAGMNGWAPKWMDHKA